MRKHRFVLLVGAVVAVVAGSFLTVNVAFADLPNKRLWTSVENQGECLYADNGRGEKAATWYPPEDGTHNKPCDEDRSLWEFDYIKTSDGGRKLYQIQYPKARPDLCLSVDNAEGGDTHVNQDLQLEPCERGDDALWWFKDRGRGVSVHNFVKGHRDLAMQADPDDWNASPRSVQLAKYGADGTRWSH